MSGKTFPREAIRGLRIQAWPEECLVQVHFIVRSAEDAMELAMHLHAGALAGSIRLDIRPVKMVDPATGETVQ